MSSLTDSDSRPPLIWGLDVDFPVAFDRKLLAEAIILLLPKLQFQSAEWNNDENVLEIR